MRNRQIPKGLRDLLPDEVKVIRNMEKKAAQLFSSYAYEEVMTPTFEYLEVIEAGRGSRREDLFLFVDREGGILSLRPEVTGSIARMASIHLHDADFPRRLFYHFPGKEQVLDLFRTGPFICYYLEIFRCQSIFIRFLEHESTVHAFKLQIPLLLDRQL